MTHLAPQKKHLIVLAVTTLVFLASLPHSADAGQSAPNPSATPAATVAQPDFTFPTALDGAKITHTYEIENSGTAPLVIEQLKTSCGCTTGDYTDEIAPGEKGTVTVVGDTTGYGGKLFRTVIQVFTNDPGASPLKLSLSGKVDAVAVVQPENLRLSGDVGETVTAEVTITPSPEYPFTITGVTFLSGKNLRHRLEQTANGYLLTLENTLAVKGRYYDAITLTTDLPGSPQLTVRVLGDIMD